MPGSSKRLSLLLVTIALALAFWPPNSKFALHAQLSTADHLADPGFWPTQDARSHDDFVGTAACANCHAAIVASQARTAMGATAMHANASEILRAHTSLTFAFDKYRYEIKTDAAQNKNTSTYTVTDGTHTQSAPLVWAFGTDRVGQSWLFKKSDDKFYEARVTWFASTKNLQFTPDRALTSAKDLDEAMFRPVDRSEIQRCFACHTTGANIAGNFAEQTLVPGVTCEACHGPGKKHVAAMQAAKFAGVSPQPEGTIFNAAELSPVDAVDSCGACHATWWDVKLSGVKGVSNAKSQPYRLVGSKCWRKGDARLTCTACHNPHKPLETDIAAYDPNCLSCHQNAQSQQPPAAAATANNATNSTNATNAKSAEQPVAKACPVATKNCASCHMPKVYLPEMHSNFTDHRIRIVRDGEPYPE
jgi:hypothetical protein